MLQPSDGYVRRDEGEIRVRVRVALGLLAGFGLFHAWASWGYAGPLWNEHGVWLHAVERFVADEVPYRDFAWSDPPLALWLVGSAARLTGAGLAAISATTLLLYLAILSLLFLAVYRLVRELALPVTLTTLLFATAYAAASGVPLPLGTSRIVVPVGVLFLLASGLCAHTLLRAPRVAAAAAVGALAGLSAASTRELWAAALYLVIVGAVLLRRGGQQRASWSLMAAFVAVLLVAIATLAAWSGGAGVAAALTGFGLAGSNLLDVLPTAERLTIEAASVAAFTLTATIALWLCLAISDRAAARWAGAALVVFLCAAAVHLGMTVAKGTLLAADGPEAWPTIIELALIRAQQAGMGLLTAAFLIFDDRFRDHLFPVLLPIFLMVVVFARWRRWADPQLRNLVALLLGLCLTARTHGGFRGSDWYNIVFEIPTYVLMMKLGGAAAMKQAGRAVLAALGMLLLLALYAYVSQARGLLTLRGVWGKTATARGMVRWAPSQAAYYQGTARLLDSLDASKARPLLSYGPTGGWNYFLGRRNPTPVTIGLYPLGAATADSLVERLASRRPGTLLLNHEFVPLSTRATIAPWFWEPRMGPSPYVAFDRPRFDRLIASCRPAGAADSLGVVTAYDCGQATR